MCSTCSLVDDLGALARQRAALFVVEPQEIGLQAIEAAWLRERIQETLEQGARVTVRLARDAGAGDSVSQMRHSLTDPDYVTNSTTGEMAAETLPRRGPVPEEA